MAFCGALALPILWYCETVHYNLLQLDDYVIYMVLVMYAQRLETEQDQLGKHTSACRCESGMQVQLQVPNYNNESD